jgi:DNA topoisomerase-3
VARDIAAALESRRGVVFTRTPWGFRSTDWIICSARGHLLSEAAPEAYDPALKEWSLETLPIIPAEVRFVPRDHDSAKLLEILVPLLNAANVDEVVNACDAGREGELIFKLIYDYSKSTKPVARAWFSSMTPDTLIAALESPRPDTQMKSLEAAAKARSNADWLVGINATRAATVKLDVHQLISLGRVQTPTLALVVGRDMLIEDFVPTPYYVVSASADFTRRGAAPILGWHQTRRTDSTPSADTTSSVDGAAEATAQSGDPWILTRFDQPQLAQEVRERVQGAQVLLRSDEKTRVRSRAPKLFDLTNLQKAANTLFGYSAARTLEIAQACYEQHKILTYPRTDSSYLPSDMAGKVSDLLGALAAQPLGSLASVSAQLLAEPDLADRVGRLLDDTKVTDHHAIIPTGTPPPTGLDEATRSVYGLVMRRFLAALSDEALYDKRVILFEAPASHDVFKTTGRTLIHAGWTTIYPGPRVAKDADAAIESTTEDEEGRELPELDQTTSVAEEVILHDRVTSAPLPYTDASLLTAMSSAGRLLDDSELAAAMKDSGLGTPATRAAIIERLATIKYLERKGKYLRSTLKARNVITLLENQILTSPEVTGRWEKALGQIEAAPGDEAVLAAERFTVAVRTMVSDLVAWFAAADTSGFTVDEVLGLCPVPGCGGQVVERKTSWSCDSYKSAEEPGCGFAIWKKQDGKRVSVARAARLLAASDGVVAAKLERVAIAPCPSENCDGEVLAKEKSYSCSSWRSPKETGCGFVLWRARKDGTVLDDDAARALVRTGVSDQRNAPEVLAPCPKPKCKGGIVEREKSFSCNSWSPKKKGCGTTLWKFSRSGAEIVTKENLDEALAALTGGA